MKKENEKLASLLAAAIACSAFACSPSVAPPVHRVQAENAWAPAGKHRSVILIAIDGVRFQDVFEGVDPRLAERYGVPVGERATAKELVANISSLVEKGAALGAPDVGTPMLASGPNFVSMPGYQEMLSGSVNTGCRDNDCDRISLPTIVDDTWRSGLGRGVAITSWPSIERAAAAVPDGADMSVGRHGGPGRRTFEDDPALRAVLEAGEEAGPEPGYDDFRRDAQTAELALAVFQTRRPSFMFVGLGETDEYAHRGDYRGYLDALSRADGVVGRFARMALHDPGSPTTLIVTTDHGRADSFEPHGGHPESARVWLVAAGAGVGIRGRTSSPEPRHLANVAPTIRALLGIAQAENTEAPLSELMDARRGEPRTMARR